MIGFAWFMLLAWPVVVAALFLLRATPQAIILSILGGYLLLPNDVGLNLPILPKYSKELAPSAAAFAMCLLVGWRQPGPRRAWLPDGTVARALVLGYLLLPILTMLMNDDALRFGPRTLPGLSPYDAGSMILGQFVQILPFLLACRYLGSEASQRTLLIMMAAAGVAYTLPVLFELRMSPQLHRWIYGFYHFKFAIEVRSGFRPVVFLEKGLWTALFIAMTTVCAAALWRAASGGTRGAAAAAALWLGGVLALMNSLGAFLLALVVAPIARLAPTRLQVMFMAGLVSVVLAFPFLRGVDVFPSQTVVETIARIDERRAGSLAFRFENEDALLERARERPWFGWGVWGRNRVYNPETGGEMSTTDSRWIITFGTYGWGGYIAEFGLLALPILLAATRRRWTPSPYTIGLCLALSVALVDMLLNDTLTPLVWLLAGATLARVETAARESGGGQATDRDGSDPGSAAPATAEANRRPLREPALGALHKPVYAKSR